MDEYIIVRERSGFTEIWMDNHRWIDPYHVPENYDWTSNAKRYRSFREAYAQLVNQRLRYPDWEYVVTEYVNR